MYLLYDRKKSFFQIRVVDKEGREKTVTQPFSLDGTRLSFGVLPRLILMSNASHIVSSRLQFLHRVTSSIELTIRICLVSVLIRKCLTGVSRAIVHFTIFARVV